MSRQFGLHLSTGLAFGPVGIIWTFLPIHLRSLGASYSLIAIVSLLPALETIILSPLWGGILDRTGRASKILTISILPLAIGFSTFPFLKGPVEFVVVVAAMGIFSASFIPVYSAIATLTSDQGYGRGIGRFWAAASLGFGSASLLGGIIYENYGSNYLFLLGAIYAYAGCLIMILARRESFTLSSHAALSKGYWGLLRDRNLAVLCFLSIVILVASSSFNSFFTLYLVDFLNSSRLVAGLAATGTTVLGAITYRLVGPLNDKLGRKRVFLAGTLGYTAYFGVLSFVTNPTIVIVLWILPIYPLIQSSAAALASDFTSPADRGKGLGLLESSVSLGGGVGPLIGGLIADATQIQSIILFSLAMSIASAIGCQIFLRDRAEIKVAPQIQRVS